MQMMIGVIIWGGYFRGCLLLNGISGTSKMTMGPKGKLEWQNSGTVIPRRLVWNPALYPSITVRAHGAACRASLHKLGKDAPCVSE